MAPRKRQPARPAPPLHERIQADLTRRITKGEWRPGERIPSTSALVKYYAARFRRPGLSPNTVRQAIIEMRARGLLFGITGSGVYVAREGDEN